jgi:protein gp37
MTKIEWTDITWNPVWGCGNNCDFCYAKSIAKRFGGKVAIINNLNQKETQDLINFKPTFLSENVKKKFPKKPKRIFVDSMSDIAYWKRGWIEILLKKANEYPQHLFQVLTKSPRKLLGLDISFPDNIWIGITATNQEDFEKRIEPLKKIKCEYRFVSFEPLYGVVYDNCDFNYIDKIIIGVQTGNHRKPTKLEWISEIVSNISGKDARNIPTFIKSIEMNGKIIKDVNEFPKFLQRRDLM